MFGVETSSLQQASVYGTKVDMGTSRGPLDKPKFFVGQSEVAKTADNLHSDLETARTNRRSNRCSKSGHRHTELSLSHSHGAFSDPGHRSPPSSVNGCNRRSLWVIEQDRNAISYPDANNQTGAAGPQTVTLIRRLGGHPRELLRQLNPMNPCTVHLSPKF